MLTIWQTWPDGNSPLSTGISQPSLMTLLRGPTTPRVGRLHEVYVATFGVLGPRQRCVHGARTQVQDWNITWVQNRLVECWMGIGTLVLHWIYSWISGNVIWIYSLSIQFCWFFAVFFCFKPHNFAVKNVAILGPWQRSRRQSAATIGCLGDWKTKGDSMD